MTLEEKLKLLEDNNILYTSSEIENMSDEMFMYLVTSTKDAMSKVDFVGIKKRGDLCEKDS